MRTARPFLSLILLLALMFVGSRPVSASPLPDEDPTDPAADPVYAAAIERAAGMVADERARALAAAYGLDLVNVTWEDTGRYQGSAVGPNISDVTIQVQHRRPDSGDYALTLIPVIRYPNFSDLTADVPLDRFYLLVGNERGEALQRVSLSEYLGNFRYYLSDPSSWAGEETSLLAGRDTHALVSAQAAFLPVPQGSRANFNPVIFNYQSYAGDPAVLVIVATREGTSATIIDNTRDAFPAGFSWGQRLFFNQAGERASFTGERLSDFSRSEGGPAQESSPEAAGESGLNMVLLIQVPLKQKNPMQFDGVEVLQEAGAAVPSAVPGDVEAAVIGHGEVEGPFTEIDGLEIERDVRFPIRVTVQFYKATSDGVVTEADIADIAAQIQRVYDDADYVGSLVLDGSTGRPTEYDGPKEEPPGWWQAFWQRFQQNTGLTIEEVLELLRRMRFTPGPRPE